MSLFFSTITEVTVSMVGSWEFCNFACVLRSKQVKVAAVCPLSLIAPR